ncbi:MAG: hypothetical protein ACKOPE_01210 [Novosphingobium sp.]
MAKQSRKPAKAKPITSHQLFPAVVALWFGALFGLGSMAVRPSLLEDLVIKSRIDLIVPQAAPPLGMTARMLLALVMAVLGAIIGIAVARRLARTKVEPHARRRGAEPVQAETARPRPRNAHPDAPVRRPISVSDDLDGAAPLGTGDGIAMRRRALAIEHEERIFVPHEQVPLPGGAPQVLSIGDVNLGSGAEPDSFHPERPADFAPVTPAASPVALDWSNAAPVARALPEADRQVFRALPAIEPVPMPEDVFAIEPSLGHEAAAAAAAGRQVFGMAAPAPADEAPRQIFGQSVENDHVSPDFVKAAGYQTTVFEQPEAKPLFAPRTLPTADEAPAAPVLAQPPAPEPIAFAPREPEPEPVAEPAPLVLSQPAPEPIAAAQAEPLPSPAGLGMTDLASRLAESMARRRAARTVDSAPPDPASQPAPIPTGFVPEPQPQVSQAQPPHPVELSAQTFAIDPVPAFAEPVAVVAPAAPSPLPSALRPLDLSGFEEDEDGDLDSLLPPRRITMPPPAVIAPTPPPMPEPARIEDAIAAPAEAAEDPVEAVSEEGYASLIGIAPALARSGFVRIGDPANEPTEIEPVVIFPGQAARAAGEDPIAQFRRFDAPASAESGQPIAANAGAPAIDADEAERALRSALANLQRMSGAA